MDLETMDLETSRISIGDATPLFIISFDVSKFSQLLPLIFYLFGTCLETATQYCYFIYVSM